MKLFAPKAAGRDFTLSQMPHNRREVFWDVLRLHWKSLLLMGLLTFLFTVPLHYVGIFQQLQTAELLEGVEAAAPEDQRMLLGQAAALQNTCALWEIPCLLLTALCLAGLLRVIRQYAWLENVYIRSDFFVGIRQNWGQSLLLALLTGIVSFAVRWCANGAAFQPNDLLSLTMLAPLLIALLCGIPTAAYAAVLLPVYDGSLWKKLRVGMFLLAKNPFRTFGALFLCLIPMALYLLPNLLLQVAARIVYSILTPCVLLGWFLFASTRLDTHIYPKYYPSLVGRGIFPADQSQTEKEK